MIQGPNTIRQIWWQTDKNGGRLSYGPIIHRRNQPMGHPLQLQRTWGDPHVDYLVLSNFCECDFCSTQCSVMNQNLDVQCTKGPRWQLQALPRHPAGFKWRGMDAERKCMQQSPEWGQWDNNDTGVRRSGNRINIYSHKCGTLQQFSCGCTHAIIRQLSVNIQWKQKKKIMHASYVQCEKYNNNARVCNRIYIWSKHKIEVKSKIQSYWKVLM